MLQNIHIKRFNNVAQYNKIGIWKRPTIEKNIKRTDIFIKNGSDICSLYIQNRLLPQFLQTLSLCK